MKTNDNLLINMVTILVIILLIIATIVTIKYHGNGIKTIMYGYNIKTDKMINEALNNKPKNFEIIKFKSDPNILINLYYSNLKIKVYYTKAVPFNNPDMWEFYCNDSSGKDIWLMSYCNVPSHKIDNNTLNRIKSICLKLIESKKL